MVCPKCSTENKGLKLNGKLFCVSCGEIMEDATEILEHSYEIESIPQKQKNYFEPRRFSKDGGDITPKPKPTVETPVNINLLKAEEEVLGEVAKISQDQRANTTVKQKVTKNNRERIAIHPSKEFSLIPNEPDPINEPELPSPHDMQIETHKNIDPEKEISYPLHTRGEQEKIDNSVKEKQKALNSFIRHTTEREPEKKVKKKMAKSTKIVAFILAIIALLVIVLGSLVFYVNNVATDAERITKTIEEKTNLEYKKPSYIPPGYEISYESYAYGNEIHYHYKYLPDTSNAIIITISENTTAESSLLESIIKPLNEDYYKHPLPSEDVWFVGNNKAFFINNNLLYEISTTTEINTEETIKIIKGLI